MPQYDFTRLSPIDFEQLICDLLSAEWGLLLESFTLGPDSGIDLRGWANSERTTIVQCKHYAGSGARMLLNHLQKTEYDKIQALNPARYVLATSVGLTPGNKQAIMTALSPFLRTLDDILSRDDIEALIRRHPAVERAHYKLWLVSAATLEAVLHNANHVQTRFEVERAQKNMPLFVATDQFHNALNILNQHRIVIIAGPPGVGKTSLAEMVLLHSLQAGYEPVAIRNEITEGKHVFRRELQQVFYFDDFLGHTFLEPRTSDRALVDFIEMVRASPMSCIIFTTREYILNNAIASSELLRHSTLHRYCVHLSLKDYSFSHKARILYNHLYFSSLPADSKGEFIRDDLYLRLLNSPHFSPRLVELVCNATLASEIASGDYRSYVKRLLDDSHLVWQHAIEYQISEASRNLLIALWSLDSAANLFNVQETWAALHDYRSKKYNYTTSPYDFRAAIMELENSFIHLEEQVVSLAPVMRDIVPTLISQNRWHIQDLIEGAVRFAQIQQLWMAGRWKYTSIGTHLKDVQALFLVTIDRLISEPVSRPRRETAAEAVGTYIDCDIEYRLETVVDIYNFIKADECVDIFEKGTKSLITDWKSFGVEFWKVRRLFAFLCLSPLSKIPRIRSCIRRLLDELLSFLENADPEALLLFSYIRKSCAEWTAEDAERAMSALNRFRDNILVSAQTACNAASEFLDFWEIVATLAEAWGADFAEQLQALEDEASRLDPSGAQVSAWWKSKMTVPVDAIYVSREGILGSERIPNKEKQRRARELDWVREMFRQFQQS